MDPILPLLQITNPIPMLPKRSSRKRCWKPPSQRTLRLQERAQ
jgi:hypothetical protein